MLSFGAPLSITPSPTTSRFGIDISKTFRRSKVMKTLETPSSGVSIVPQPPSKPASKPVALPPTPKPTTHPPAPEGSGIRIAVVAFIVLLLGIGIFLLQSQ